jgi:ABC-type branched-subunit amino acid transport system ATPase component/branched-subunit amino acid ABC-type transport system permease component
VISILIAGVVTGSVYGLIAVGLVLTYNTSGIFNFAYGALGTVAVYIFYVVSQDWHLPVGLALFLATIGIAVLLGVVLEKLAGKLSAATLAAQIAATVGLLLVVEAAAELIFGVNTVPFPSFLPQGGISVAGTDISYTDIITLGLSVAATIGLNVFLRRSRLGTSMRAVVENSDLLSLSGTDPRFIRRLAWTIGTLLVACSALLLAPGIGLSATNLTSLMLFGFGAAAIAGFRNLNLAWLGGIAIGVPQALLTRYISSTSILGNLAATLPYLALFIVILFYPRAKVRLGANPHAIRAGDSKPMSTRRVLALSTVLLVILGFVPVFSATYVTAWAATMAEVILLLSLGLLVRMSGQVSLCQVTFAAIGVVAFAKLTGSAHLPWGIALILAGLIVVPVGMLVAIPAARLSGVYLALGTLGLGLTVQNLFYQSSWMFGASDLGVQVPAPKLSWLTIGTPTGIYYLVLICAVIAAVLVTIVGRSRLGRLLRSASDAPIGLETLGTNITAIRLLVFGLSAFLAAVSGALLGVVYSDVNGLSFDPSTSLLYLVLIVIVVGDAPWYALVAAVGVGVIPTYVTFGSLPYYLEIVFGLSAIVVGYRDGAMHRRTTRKQSKWASFPSVLIARLGSVDVAKWAGTQVSVRRHARRPSGGTLQFDGAASGAPASRAAVDGAESKFTDSLPLAPSGSTAASASVDGGPTTPCNDSPMLEVAGLTVRFGGLVAVDNVDIRVDQGGLIGLIGANGAGKTSVFNACSGLLRPAGGAVLYGGREINHRSSSWRARNGLGRTFQHLQLFDSLTVEENVRLGREAAMAGWNPVSMLISSSGQRNEVRHRAEEALDLCDLNAARGERVGNLPTGTRRLVELARCLAGGFRIILLDEPSAGLDSTETRAFGGILNRAASDGQVGVLLVEHDMEFVMSVCSYIYVLNFGKLIFEGTPEDVRSSASVQNAYLGPSDSAMPGGGASA